MIGVARKGPLEGPLSHNSNHILQYNSFLFPFAFADITLF